MAIVVLVVNANSGLVDSSFLSVQLQLQFPAQIQSGMTQQLPPRLLSPPFQRLRAGCPVMAEAEEEAGEHQFILRKHKLGTVTTIK